MGEQIDHDQLAMKIHLLVSSGEFHSEENPPEDAWLLERYAADFFLCSPCLCYFDDSYQRLETLQFPFCCRW
jgi:hypothetical protein